MAKHVLIELDDDEHERYRRVKDWNGLTWGDVLDLGIGTLDSPLDPPSDEE